MILATYVDVCVHLFPHRAFFCVWNDALYIPRRLADMWESPDVREPNLSSVLFFPVLSGSITTMVPSDDQ